MENLIKEMKECQDLLRKQSKEIVEKLMKVNAMPQNSQVRNFSNVLSGCYKSIYIKIELIEYNIKKIKDLS